VHWCENCFSTSMCCTNPN